MRSVLRMKALAAVICGLAAALLSPAAAWAEPCQDLQATDKLRLQPFILAPDAGVKIVSAECRDGAATFAFARRDGVPAAQARIVGRGDHADISFRILAPLANAAFGFEANVKAQSAELFDTARTQLRPNGSEKAETYYPYAWKRPGERDVRHADSVIPGFKAGGLNVVYDANGLGAINLVRRPGAIEALFPYFREFNVKGDAASHRHDLKPGDVRQMRVYFHAGLSHIQDRRFAAPDRAGMQGAHIAQFVPDRWTPDPAVVDRAALARDPTGLHCAAPRPGAGRPCFATDDEMRAFAAAMPKENSIVVARIALPTPAAAAAIRAGGATPYYYLFFGAVSFRDGDPAFRRDGLLLMDSSGQAHMAPYSTQSKGNWLLLDLTRPEARGYFVGRALEALDAGYAGVFMDGGFLWNMPNGRVGGDNPEAAISQYRGRTLLMRELRAAMRARDPAARIGILANPYAEYMHYADWVLREGTALHWQVRDALPYLRAVAWRPDQGILERWRSQYARLIEQPVFYACKGPSAVLVRTCRANLNLEHAGFYYDSGSWPISNSESAAFLVREAYGPGDLYVTRVEGDAKLIGDGVSRLRLEAGAGRVWFSRAAPLLRWRTLTPHGGTSHVYRFEAGEAYAPADRKGPGGWTWAAHGFVHRNAETFVAGDFYVVEPPSSPAPGKLRVVVAPEPRLKAASATAPVPGAPSPDTAMSFEIALPAGANWRLDDMSGRPLRGVAVARRDGRVTVEADGAARAALTLTLPRE